jgi:hypothetical protein
MKKYAACKYWMDQSLHPWESCEYLFEVTNVLLTARRAVRNLSGNPILETTEKVWKKSKEHLNSPELRALTTMKLIHERTAEHHD